VKKSEHTITRRVEFSETDMAGIVHFSQFFRYMEAAEHDLFRSLGHSIVTDIDGVHFGWPRVRAECDYTAPLRFEDEVEVRVLIREMRPKAILLDFEFTRLHGGERELVARGGMTADRRGGVAPRPRHRASDSHYAISAPTHAATAFHRFSRAGRWIRERPSSSLTASLPASYPTS